VSDVARIQLSLISHTNVGKTTLARTLLGRTLGEVRDAPHVTAVAEAQTMIETPEGDALALWDTPGFGDSVRLAKRLRQSGSPIGWFLSQVWDRWRDRPFWSSQEAVRNVRDHADVVLYLVNAAENPGDAGYVAPEMQILEWVGKPAIVLLNQVGAPRPRADEATEEARWRAHLGGHRIVRAVLTLDAFARCWVQEFTLLAAVAEALPGEKRPAFDRLRAAWRARRMSSFDAAGGSSRRSSPAPQAIASRSPTAACSPRSGKLASRSASDARASPPPKSSRCNGSRSGSTQMCAPRPTISSRSTRSKAAPRRKCSRGSPRTSPCRRARAKARRRSSAGW
jgi:hypothetical protein